MGVRLCVAIHYRSCRRWECFYTKRIVKKRSKVGHQSLVERMRLEIANTLVNIGVPPQSPPVTGRENLANSGNP